MGDRALPTAMPAAAAAQQKRSGISCSNRRHEEAVVVVTPYTASYGLDPERVERDCGPEFR